MPKEYLFSPGVTLRENQGNFFIESSDPLRFLRLNRAAYELLEHLGTRSSPIHSGSSQTTEMKTDSFLDGLEKAGYIHLQGSAPETLPSISIIVPVRNRVSELHACVSSLAALNYPLSRFEIIVVDDASSPPVSISLEDVHIKLAVSPVHGGAAHARNLGCRIATGEFVAFIDSDCVARSDWLRELVAYIPEPGIVGGVVNHPGDTNIDRYENVRSPLYLGRIGRRLDLGSEFTYLPTCNMLVSRKLFEEIGGFDESLPIGEDVDLTWKAALHGSIEALFHHAPRSLSAISNCHGNLAYGFRGLGHQGIRATQTQGSVPDISLAVLSGGPRLSVGALASVSPKQNAQAASSLGAATEVLASRNRGSSISRRFGFSSIALLMHSASDFSRDLRMK